MSFFYINKKFVLNFSTLSRKCINLTTSTTSNVVLLKIAKNHMIFTIDQTSTINMQYCMCFGLPKCNALNNIRVCEWVLLSESFLWIFSILSFNRSKSFQDDWIFILFRWNILFWNSNLSNPKSKYTNTSKNL